MSEEVRKIFTPREHEANLKAAASPMYYALKRILDSGESGCIPIEILQPAINAVAKAEGRS